MKKISTKVELVSRREYINSNKKGVKMFDKYKPKGESVMYRKQPHPTLHITTYLDKKEHKRFMEMCELECRSQSGMLRYILLKEFRNYRRKQNYDADTPLTSKEKKHE
jgi:hypothetical protein